MEDRDLSASAFYFVLDNVVTPVAGTGAVDNMTRVFAQFFVMDTRSVPPDAFTAGNLVRNALICDFEAVMFCKKGSSPTRKNLIVSFAVAYLFYLVVSLILDSTFFTSFVSPLWKTVILVTVVPAMAFQLAYGIGPACAPMIPTCLLQDIVLYTQVLLPIKIVWPDALQHTPGCLANSTLSAYERQLCLRSCRGAPFFFRSWESTLSWAYCSLWDPLGCNSSLPWPSSLLQMPADLQAALTNHSGVLSSSYANATGAMDLWHANQFCFIMTLGQSIPYMFLAVAVVLGAAQLVRMPLALVAAATQFLWQALAFTHAE